MTKTCYLVDTCSFVLQFHHPQYAELFDDLISRDRLLLSAVVLMELYAGTRSKEVKKKLDNLSLVLNRERLVATPDYSDYQKAGILLRNYSRQKGEIGVSSHFRDVLISLSAVRMDAIVVTENRKDFLIWRKEIKRSFKKDFEVYSAKDLLI